MHLDDRLAVEKRNDVCTVFIVGEIFPVSESADTLTHHVRSAESRLDSDTPISKWFISRQCDVDIICETLRPQEDLFVERNGCSLLLMVLFLFSHLFLTNFFFILCYIYVGKWKELSNEIISVCAFIVRDVYMVVRCFSHLSFLGLCSGPLALMALLLVGWV